MFEPFIVIDLEKNNLWSGALVSFSLFKYVRHQQEAGKVRVLVTLAEGGSLVPSTHTVIQNHHQAQF